MADVAKILLASLRRRNFHLAAQAASETEMRLIAEPSERLTEADRRLLVQHRDALLDLLHWERPLVDPRGPGPGYFWRPPNPYLEGEDAEET